MTSKQRSKLKSIAANLSPVTQIGKGGISENLLRTLSEALDAREIIKVNVLPTAEADADTMAQNAAELLGAEVVYVIGRKAVFYRRSRRDDVEHIEL
ncbi:MAG TPA: YhbY family RNA-binding protein [Firmicutes bacterium]|nr:YhbY family RNA-binding protein [Bacillota bacterium]